MSQEKLAAALAANIQLATTVADVGRKFINEYIRASRIIHRAWFFGCLDLTVEGARALHRNGLDYVF